MQLLETILKEDNISPLNSPLKTVSKMLLLDIKLWNKDKDFFEVLNLAKIVLNDMKVTYGLTHPSFTSQHCLITKLYQFMIGELSHETKELKEKCVTAKNLYVQSIDLLGITHGRKDATYIEFKEGLSNLEMAISHFKLNE